MYFHSEAETYQIKAGEKHVKKDHCIMMQINKELLWGKKWQNWKIVKFGLCKQSKIWIPAAKFDEFCKQKFEKPGILFCAVFVGYLYINYSTELDAY